MPIQLVFLLDVELGRVADRAASAVVQAVVAVDGGVRCEEEVAFGCGRKGFGGGTASGGRATGDRRRYAADEGLEALGGHCVGGEGEGRDMEGIVKWSVVLRGMGVAESSQAWGR